MSKITETRAAADEEEFGLPEGWTSAVLGELSTEIQYGYTASAIQDSYGPRLLRITDIQDGKVDWKSVPSCEIDNSVIDKYRLAAGDIVFARTGATTGKSFLISDCPEAVFASYLIRVRAHQLIEPRFLVAFFNTPSYWSFISDNVAGNAQPNCNASKLAALPIPVAPASEQTRIVSRIEKLSEQVNASRERLEKVPKILKAFRQSVLAAACSGQLTEDWRNTHPTEVLDWISNGPRAGATIDMPSDIELPDGWLWCSLREIAELRGGVTKGRDLRGRRTIRLPYLRVANVQDGYLDLSEIKTIDVLPEDAPKYRLTRGDILFTEGGDRDKLGRGTLWNEEIPDCIHQNHIFRARVTRSDIIPSYISLATKSQYAKDYFFHYASQTVNLASINLTALGRVPLGLPCTGEQAEVIRRVEALFNLANMIEKRVKIATTRADTLRQAIIAKVFRGELVPTEAELARAEGRDYEPASILLERIRKERSENVIEQDTASRGLQTRKRLANSRPPQRSRALRGRRT
jgi:type I restriction enzyme, S subunit